MKTMRNALSALVLAVLVLCLSICAAAQAVPDLSRRGSITITTRMGDTLITGGSLTLYHAGEAVEEDGNFLFRPTEAFASCKERLDDLENNAALAARLRDYVKKEKLTGQKETINSKGKAVFEDLAPGVYLIVQEEPSPGYAKLDPFLISLPYLEDGEYVYDISANPKTDFEEEPTEPPTTEPKDPAIPQTGQLWWPVPLLACAGLALFALGMVLNRRNGTDEA